MRFYPIIKIFCRFQDMIKMFIAFLNRPLSPLVCFLSGYFCVVMSLKTQKIPSKLDTLKETQECLLFGIITVLGIFLI